MVKFFQKTAGWASASLARRPEVVFRLQEWWLKFGYRVLDLGIASWVIRRPEWLIRKSKANVTPLEPELPSVTMAIDESISMRLISRYPKASAGESGLVPDTSMWGTLRQEHYANLRSRVESGDSKVLAPYLAKLFRTEAVNGYSYGTTFNRWPHRWAYLAIGIELSVVTLAECVGILRAENHEQGQTAYWRLQYSEEQLMDRLEAYFGFRIQAPRFGDPRGIMFGGRFIVRETCSHLYTAQRIREIFTRNGTTGPFRVVEIGGGYGGTCYWLRKLMADQIARYVIVDLPEVSIVQSYFLGCAEPNSLVIYGESREGIESPIELIPHHNLSAIDFKPNVLINQDSMPEMPLSEVDRYLEWGSENLDGLFISFNQEAYSPWAGIPQVHVPTVVAKFRCYKRLSRETSWDRRGYVEEVYHCA